MIRFAIFSVLSAFLWACADKPAPVAPAAKASDFGSMFDSFIESCKYKGIFYSLSCAYLKKPRIRSLS